jgi:nucleotide-binding universal stress UspA family protein
VVKRPRIVVGVDGSAGARAALSWALDEARLREAELDVVHGWHLPIGTGEAGSPVALAILVGAAEEDAKDLVDRMVAEADTRGVSSVEKILVCEGAADVLLRVAQGADLLVVGARSRNGVAGFVLGSVADEVARHAPCPVAVIPFK